MNKPLAGVYTVCVIAGYLMSYWNRPFFPEWCGDGDLDNSQTYDTMVRIVGSYFGIAQAFKKIADEFALGTPAYCAKTAEPIVSQLVWRADSCVPRYHLLEGGPYLPTRKGNFEGFRSIKSIPWRSQD